jgi:hypothetical protein
VCEEDSAADFVGIGRVFWSESSLQKRLGLLIRYAITLPYFLNVICQTNDLETQCQIGQGVCFRMCCKPFYKHLLFINAICEGINFFVENRMYVFYCNIVKEQLMKQEFECKQN